MKRESVMLSCMLFVFLGVLLVLPVVPVSGRDSTSSSGRTALPSTFPRRKSQTELEIPSKKSRFLDRYFTKLFESSDINHDMTLSLDECYMLVLQLYIQINQNAPIPPPSRAQVWKLVQLAQDDNSGATTTTGKGKFRMRTRTRNADRVSVDRQEFDWLARTLLGRALSRVIAHKLVTLLGAPILAEVLLRRVFCSQVPSSDPNLVAADWWISFANGILPESFHDRWLHVLLSPAFIRTLLVVVMVAFLANLVLNVVNRILDDLLPQQDDLVEIEP